MKFLIDNALSPSVALALRSEGHNVLHVRDINLQRANDEVIIRRASDEDRILISADTDFGSLLAIQLKSGATKTRSHKVSQKGTKSKSFSLCFGDFVAKMMFSTAFLEPLHENLPGSFLGLQQT